MTKLFSIFNKKNHINKEVPGHVSYINLVGNDAFTDWALIFTATFVVAVTMISIGGYVYFQTKASLSADRPVGDLSGLSVHFDANKLKQVITTFDGRAGERVLLSKGYDGPKDPSLP